jgi:hypothetical protein
MQPPANFMWCDGARAITQRKLTTQTSDASNSAG